MLQDYLPGHMATHPGRGHRPAEQLGRHLSGRQQPPPGGGSGERSLSAQYRQLGATHAPSRIAARATSSGSPIPFSGVSEGGKNSGLARTEYVASFLDEMPISGFRSAVLGVSGERKNGIS